MPRPVLMGDPTSRPPDSVLQLHLFYQADLPAVFRYQRGVGRHFPRIRKIFRCNTPCRRCRGIELRRLKPLLRGGQTRKRTGLVVEECEYLVFPDRPTETAAVIVCPVRIPVNPLGAGAARRRDTGSIAIKPLVCIQARPRRLEERAAMQMVSAGLGDDLNLCAAEAPILRVVAVGNDSDGLHRIFAWGDDRGASPNRADGVDAID